MHENEAIILSEINSERHLIPTDQFTAVQEEHTRTGKSLFNIITDFGLVSEDQLLQAVADHLNLEYISLDATELSPSALNAMPSSVARMYGAVPVALTGNNIMVAVLDPFNPHLVEELSFVLGKDVQLLVAPRKQIEEVIARHFSEESGSLKQVLEDMETELAKDKDLMLALDKASIGGAALEEVANQAPIVRFVNLILFQAIQDRASDIHFEPFEEEFKIRYRVDGALYEMAPPPKHLA